MTANLDDAAAAEISSAHNGDHLVGATDTDA